MNQEIELGNRIRIYINKSKIFQWLEVKKMKRNKTLQNYTQEIKFELSAGMWRHQRVDQPTKSTTLYGSQ